MCRFNMILLSVCIVVLWWDSTAMGVSVGKVEKLTAEELKSIMKTIPISERRTFIRNNIELGYKIQELKEETSNEEEGRLAVQIFNYFVDNQEAILKSKTIVNVLLETICYPDPIGCIDPDDPSIRPLL